MSENFNLQKFSFLEKLAFSFSTNNLRLLYGWIGFIWLHLVIWVVTCSIHKNTAFICKNYYEFIKLL